MIGPERVQARFVMRGDLIAVQPIAEYRDAPRTPETFLVTNVAFAGDDVLIEGLDVLGGIEDIHLYLDTEVEMRQRGWVDESPAGDWTLVRRQP